MYIQCANYNVTFMLDSTETYPLRHADMNLGGGEYIKVNILHSDRWASILHTNNHCSLSKQTRFKKTTMSYLMGQDNLMYNFR